MDAYKFQKNIHYLLGGGMNDLLCILGFLHQKYTFLEFQHFFSHVIFTLFDQFSTTKLSTTAILLSIAYTGAYLGF